MKKIILLAAMLCTMLSIVWPAEIRAAGQNLSIAQVITKEGQDGVLETTWRGKPDKDGQILLPLPSGKAVFVRSESQGGVLLTERPEEVVLEGQKVLRFLVKAEGSEVTLRCTQKLPKLFAPPEQSVDAEGGPTRRGDIRTLKYSFTNTLLAGIGEYKCTVVLPAGAEIFRIIAPKKYQHGEKNGQQELTASLKGKDGNYSLYPGMNHTIEFEYVEVSRNKWGLWLVITVLAALSLIYRRDVLKAETGGK